MQNVFFDSAAVGFEDEIEEVPIFGATIEDELININATFDAILHEQSQEQEIVREAIERYLKNCSVHLQQEVHPFVANYLRLIPDYWPCTMFVLGQNPYVEELLPYYASAFAFDPTSQVKIPPSVQVLSQMLALNGVCSVYQYTKLLAVSFTQIKGGLVFLNVRCSDTKNARDIIGIESYFAELMLDFIKSLSRCAISKIRVINMGDVASELFEQIVSAMPNDGSLQSLLEVVNIQHPVGINRYMKPVQEFELDIQKELIALYNNCNVPIRNAKLNKGNSNIRPTFSMYSKEKLSKLQSIQRIKWLAVTMMPNALESTVLKMQNKQRSKGGMGTDSTLLESTVKNIHAELVRYNQQLEQASIRMTQSLVNVPTDDAQQISVMVSEIEQFRNAAMLGMSIITAMGSTLTSARAAISFSDSSVNPLMVTDMSIPNVPVVPVVSEGAPLNGPTQVGPQLQNQTVTPGVIGRLQRHTSIAQGIQQAVSAQVPTFQPVPQTAAAQVFRRGMGRSTNIQQQMPVATNVLPQVQVQQPIATQSPVSGIVTPITAQSESGTDTGDFIPDDGDTFDPADIFFNDNSAYVRMGLPVRQMNSAEISTELRADRVPEPIQTNIPTTVPVIQPTIGRVRTRSLLLQSNSPSGRTVPSPITTTLSSTGTPTMGRRGRGN